MYNSLGMPNIYCTIIKRSCCVYFNTRRRYNIVLVLIMIAQLGVSLVD